MCGIVGIWNPSSSPRGILEGAVARLAHRGPDDSGVWFDDGAGAGLGHARLSILDLSPAGHQPMLSACGRYVLVFNGEIYNHLALREQLGPQAPAWRGHADTETLLACFAAWGAEKTLKATVGMFAIALWDRQEGSLLIARDRLGEKPLYYGYLGPSLVFASELKALRNLPGGAALEVDKGSLALLLRNNYIPSPYCIYRGLAKLLPGTFLKFSTHQVHRKEKMTPTVYWSAIETALSGIAEPLQFRADAEAVDALETRLSDAIGGQMISDVPLGAFLSGGVDSSLVAALMQKRSRTAIKTFSIGFHERAFDEAGYAAAVARQLRTDHTELYVSSADAQDVIPRLPTIYDEPFSDASQIPTYLLAQMARQHVTVSLSGDGGDELFCGYTCYTVADRLWRRISRIPWPLRRAAAAALQVLPPQAWDRLFKPLGPAIPQRLRAMADGEMLQRRAQKLACNSAIELYRQLVMHWDSAFAMPDMEEPAIGLDIAAASSRRPVSAIEQMMLLDTTSYMPDGVLVKVDRAAMAHGLETRVPLLDHRIVEFAWRLPLHYKLRDGTGKWLLRQLLYRHVPRELVDRPKKGFSVPIGSWLRGPLRDWAEALLDESRLRQEGFFDPAEVRRKWSQHLSGQHDWASPLWNLLMFQAWHEHTMKPRLEGTSISHCIPVANGC